MTLCRSFIVACLLLATCSFGQIYYDSGFTWRGYTGTVEPTCPSKLCHYFAMNTFDESYYKEFTAWKSTTGNPNSASAFTNFRVVFPAGYNVNDNTKLYPLIVMFHGAGESGRVWSKHYNYAPTDSTYDNNSHHLKHGGNQHRMAVGKPPSNTGSFPGIVVFPQASYNGVWGDTTTTNLNDNEQMLLGFIESQLIARYHVDPNRIVAHGLSNGAKSLWAIAQKRPDLFAAIAPMSGVPYNKNQAADILVTTPLRLFQGGLDINPTPSAANQVINAFLARGGTPEYFLYEDLGHGTWNRAYNEPDFFLWLRNQDKRRIHVFGGSTELCNNAVRLGFSAGMIAYQWTRDGVDLVGANTQYLPNITQPGRYAVKFQRPNGQWDVSFDVQLSASSSCSGDRPVLSSTLSKQVCSGIESGITLEDNGGPVSAATFNITAINFNGLVATAGSPVTGEGFYNVEIIDDTYSNPGTAPVNVIYTVVPVSSDGITGDPADVVLTVNPQPALSTSLDVARCSDVATGITLDDNGASANATAFNISAIETNGLIASAGSPATGTNVPPTAISDDAYTNQGVTASVVTYTVAPVSASGCIGSSQAVSVTVQPEPVMSSALDASVASNAPSGIILDDDGVGTSAASFDITAINFNGLAPSAGSPATGTSLPASVISDDAYTNNGSAVNVIYTIVPKSDIGCAGNATDVVLTVGTGTPSGGNIVVTRCSDVASGVILSASGAASYNITAINFDGLVASAGNPATGTGFPSTVIQDDAFTNATTAPKSVVYTVEPVSSSGSVGSSFTVTLTVNPEPVLAQLNATRCSRVASGIVLNDNGTSVAAQTFTIASIDFGGLEPSAGTPAQGTELTSGVIADDAFFNNTASAVTVTYAVVPVSAAGCPGNGANVVLTVQPEPVMNTALDAAVTSGEPSGITLDDNGGGTDAASFNITAINFNGLTASAGAPATGNSLAGSVISDDAYVNNGSAAVNVIYTVSSNSSAGCVGAPANIVLTVEPAPPVADGINVTRCSDIATGVTLASTGGVTYNITEINFDGLTPSAGNPATGTGFPPTVIQDDAYTNAGLVPRNVVYTVVPVSNTGATGSPAHVTVTVNPKPALAQQLTATRCSRLPSEIILRNDGDAVHASTFNITFISLGGLVTAAGSPTQGTGFGSGEIADDAFINQGTSNVTVAYTVVPVSDAGCFGDSAAVTFVVQPEPVLSNTLNATVDSDVASGITLDDNGGAAATSFDITSIAFNGLTASAGSPATGTNLTANVISDDAYTNNGENAVSVVYTVVPSSIAGCRGEAGTVTLTVNAKIEDDDDDGYGDGDDPVTAVDPGTMEPLVSVYPNPTRGTLFIRFHGAVAPRSLYLVTSSGQATEVAVSSNEDGVLEMDISHLQPGLYMLRGSGLSAKIVKY
jgi:predicted esterase